MAFSDLIKHNNPQKQIEYRLFDISLWMTLTVFSFWTIYAFAYGYSTTVKIIYSFCLVLFSVIFFLWRKTGNFDVLTIIFYVFGFIMLAVSWLPASGLDGAILHMFVLIYVSGLLVLPMRKYLIFIVSATSMVVFFLIYEYHHPEAAFLYDDRSAKILDMGIAGIIMLSVLGFCLYIFKDAYVKDRKQLKSLIKEIEAEKEKVVRAHEVKSEFLTTISHEMRTPLNGIIGTTEMMRRTAIDSEQADMIRNLRNSGMLLNSMISDVLDFSLMEEGSLNLRSDEINISQELNDLQDMFGLRIRQMEKDISLDCRIAADVPEKVIGDLHRFRQIMINLLSNAVKFTYAGSVRVEVNQMISDKSFHYLQFVVEDTGPGISKEIQEQVFDKFFKAGHDSDAEGPGLGLSISKRLAELMGGQIKLSSTEGKGSVFYFEAPFKAVKSDMKEKDAERITDEAELSDPAKLHVLIVDDVKMNQIVIRKLIENLGIVSIETASNGKVAFEMACENQFDYIFMDIQMPVMNGIESSRHITAHYTSGGTAPVIIAVTANTLTVNLSEYLEAGIKEVIYKPVTSEMLMNMIRKYPVPVSGPGH